MGIKGTHLGKRRKALWYTDRKREVVAESKEKKGKGNFLCKGVRVGGKKVLLGKGEASQ